MANSTFERDQAFSLPSEFLTFDDILINNKIKKQSQTSEFNFPSEFPFELELNKPPHPFPSYRNYEFQKRRLGLAGSPPAKVAHFGRSSVSGGGGGVLHHQPPPAPRNSGFSNAFVQRVREEQLLMQQQQRSVWSNAQNWNFEKQNRVGGLAIGAFGENEQVAWRSLQYMRQQNQENRSISRADFVNGGSGNQFSGGVKKQRSGTGVFLPRSYGTNNNNHTNKPGGLTTPIVDMGGQAPFRNFNAMGSGVVQPPGQTRFLDGFDSDYDLELAKMKLLLMQRRQHIRAASMPLKGTY